MEKINDPIDPLTIQEINVMKLMAIGHTDRRNIHTAGLPSILRNKFSQISIFILANNRNLIMPVFCF